MTHTLQDALEDFDVEAEFFLVIGRSKSGKLLAAYQVPPVLVAPTSELLADIIQSMNKETLQ